MGRLSGEVALITGGTRGVGEAVVRRCAAEGAKLVFTGRNSDNGRQIEKDIRTSGGEATYVQVDMESEDDIRRSIEKAISLHGPLTVLVNNAAPIDQGALDQGPEDTPTEVWDRLIRLNLTSAAFIPCKYAIPSMIEAGKGSIVQISSAASLRAGAGVAYSTGKAACNALMTSLALKYAPNGIRANAIAMGYVPGPSTADLEGLDEQFRRLTPLGSGKGEDLANFVAFLASDEARWITGQTMSLDGGMIMYLPGSLDGSVEQALALAEDRKKQSDKV